MNSNNHRWERTPQSGRTFVSRSSAFIGGFKEDAARWCQNQTPIWRAPIWIYLLHAGCKHLFDDSAPDLFALITFGIHELGHVAFGFFGEFIAVAGGSLAQILAPLIVLAMFYRQRDYFALCVGGYWLSSSLYNLSVYIGDARAQTLELVSPFAALSGEEPIHDWHYILSRLGLLRFDVTFSILTKLEAFAVLVASLAWGAWLLWRMTKKSL